ncbi:MAG: GrpB family protein [Lachnospiraceae bacterium]|nr:GrpB family protein [Lachnospiraceae bacterium]
MDLNTSLSELSLEALWELFPILLTEHKSCWGDWYEEEQQRIRRILHKYDLRIHHIGSTAVEHLWAKPIVDILMELSEYSSITDIKEQLVKGGYLCMSEKENRVSLNRGYTDTGFAERVFHVHVRFEGDNDELYFRDFLRSHPSVAKEYEALKISLWKKYEHNRDAYTNAKSEFIRKYTELAKAEYGNRYKR